MHQTELQAAIKALQKRECTSENNIGYIAGTKRPTKFPMILDTLFEWLDSHPYDALLWTDLKSNFDDYNETAVLEYLRKEADKAACRAYINKVPKQIDTDMWRSIVRSGVLEL